MLNYCNLQLYLSLGMRLKKIHRALKFKQSPWMEPYIRMNADLRKEARSDFEKDLYKLMNNSVFGKTIENLQASQCQASTCKGEGETVAPDSQPDICTGRHS